MKFPSLLLFIYLSLFTYLGLNPYDRTIWWAENIPVLLIVAGLTLTYKLYTFSPTAYFTMFIFIILHTIGGHFTFARVPFDFITNLFGFERNHYDRMAHFSVGFYAYPMAELLLRKKWTASRFVLITFPIFFIFSVASIYEIIEWLFAVMANPSPKTAIE